MKYSHDCKKFMYAVERVSEKEFKHIVRKLTRDESVGNSTIKNGLLSVPGIVTVNCEIYDAVYFPRIGAISYVDDYGRGAFVESRYAFFRRMRINMGMVNEMHLKQMTHWRNRTSHVLKKESEKFFKPTTRAKNKRMLADLGIVV